MKNILLSLLATALLVSGRAPIPQSPDLVPTLPQMADLSFGLYSGLLPIAGTKKQLH